MSALNRGVCVLAASLLLGCSLNNAVLTRVSGPADKTRPPSVRKTETAAGSASSQMSVNSGRTATSEGLLRLPAQALTRIVEQKSTAANLLGKAKLTGRVKLLLNQGGSIVSNTSGTLLSDQGGSLIANNSGNLAPQFQLAQTQSTATESLLADAGILVQDATGRFLVDENNQPLGAVTDRAGHYTLNAALPSESLVLRVPLWKGGDLLAIATQVGSETLELPIDTATSLGSAYVLEQFVQGRQEVLNRLSTLEATKLRTHIQAAQALLDSVPSYETASLVQMTTRLRESAPAVNESLETIRALLLGQVNLGSGLMALEVPLSGPSALLADGQGGYFVSEGTLGRIRRVSADGRMTTWADRVQGEVKANFFAAVDMARSSDGAVYVTSFNDGYGVVRIAPDASFARVAGVQMGGRGELGQPAVQTAIFPFTLWVDAQDQLWIGEEGQPNVVTRILKLMADGTLQEAGVPSDTWVDATVTGLCSGTNGSVMASLRVGGVRTEIWKLNANGGPWTLLYTTEETASRWTDLVSSPDGTLYLSMPGRGTIVRVFPDGTSKPVYQALEKSELREPRDMQALPDGRLRVVSNTDNRIYEVEPKTGQAVAVAGLLGNQATGNQIPINSPFAVAVNDKGVLHIVEAATSLIKAWDGKEVKPVVGSGTGYSGDGGPAIEAELNKPTGLTFAGGALYILDQLNGALREVGPNGVINTIAGGPTTPVVENGAPVDPMGYKFKGAIGLVMGPDEALYWSSFETNQVVRMAPGGKISLVAGVGGQGGDSGENGLPEEARLNTPFGLAFSPTGELFLSDTGNMRIRRISQGQEGRKMTTFGGLGLIQTLATMTARDFSNGPRAATAIPLLFPGPLCFDARGNLYVGELGTNNLPILIGMSKGLQNLDITLLPKVPARILKIQPNGATTVLAGPGGQFFADPAGNDALILPTGLTVDALGRLIIADAGANLVRILPAGAF